MRWSARRADPHRSRLYHGRDRSPGYTNEGVTGYIHQLPRLGDGSPGALCERDRLPLLLHAVGPPTGYATDLTLGYVDQTAGEGLLPLARHYSAGTKKMTG